MPKKLKPSLSLLESTLNLFNLNKIDRDIYTWTGKSVGWARIFGGQVMAQTLIAAYETIEKKHMAHSFHGYFLRPGQMDKPIVFDVDRIRDGKSFSTRRVRAIQEGEAIFNSSISFQKREKGLTHQIDMPEVPGPEGLLNEWQHRKNASDQIDKKYLPIFLREREIEMRPVEPQDFLNPKKSPPYKNTWMKPDGIMPKDEKIHQALLLYASDMGLLGTANNPHGLSFMSPLLQSASLDHATWFHSKLDFSDWLLYHINSPVSGNARGFSRGSIYSKDGKLVASCAQEGLMRVWDKPKPTK
tara:strand:+ start:238 stop:1137 length:900 start_codon:yes stop_codon:yes gene_type:complete